MVCSCALVYQNRTTLLLEDYYLILMNPPESTRASTTTGHRIRSWGYPVAVSLVLVGWVLGVTTLSDWPAVLSQWRVTLTMVFGSFVAGATSEGGGAVAFPVFTKVLGIPSAEARIFSLMIQSIGMTMAGLVIWLRRIPVSWPVVQSGLLGGMIGFTLGSVGLAIPDPFPKWLFTFVTAIFGLFLVWNRWGSPHARRQELAQLSFRQQLQVIIAGVMGGAVTSTVGVGVDMVVFIYLTLRIGLDEKVSTPTTVVLMGLLSVFGFGWHLIAGNIEPQVVNYWLSAVPVVIFGAPLGAWVCSKLKRDQLLGFLLSLIALEVVSTFILLPLTPSIGLALGGAFVVCVGIFSLLIRWRDAEDRLERDVSKDMDRENPPLE